MTSVTNVTARVSVDDLADLAHAAYGLEAEIEELHAERAALAAIADEAVAAMTFLEAEVEHTRPATTARGRLLEEAAEIIDGSRDLDYGTAELNQGRIAALWTVLFGIEVTPRQACLALVLVKVARDVHTPKHDNLVDIAGYAALAAEVSS